MANDNALWLSIYQPHYSHMIAILKDIRAIADRYASTFKHSSLGDVTIFLENYPSKIAKDIEDKLKQVEAAYKQNEFAALKSVNADIETLLNKLDASIYTHLQGKATKLEMQLLPIFITNLRNSFAKLPK